MSMLYPDSPVSIEEAESEGMGKEMVFVESPAPTSVNQNQEESRDLEDRPNRYSVVENTPSKQRRFFEEDEKKTDDIEPSAMERDFDLNPTELYVMVQKKQWSSAVKRLSVEPDEARMWVSRREKDGKLRWRLLPIHAAIVFRAPEHVVEHLLAAYPKGAQSKDDQGMLPLHLAFRNGSTEAVVNLLLVSFPQSVDVKDRKGRIPLVLAQASTSPNRKLFLQALERGPTYYAVAAAATERAAVTAEQRAMFDAKMMQVRQSHQHELVTQRMEYERVNQELELRVASLEADLSKTQETSQILVDHVNSLEAQLTSRSDTERFLATKIATLDNTLKDTHRSKGELETSLKMRNNELELERDNLKNRLLQAQSTIEDKNEHIQELNAEHATKERDLEETKSKLASQLKALEADWANAKANCAILDAQLKKKMNTEHALASQVSSLAGKLAESAAEARDATKNFIGRIRNLEQERKHLRISVKDLTKRLSDTLAVLTQIAQDKEELLTEQEQHGVVLQQSVSDHAKTVSETMQFQASMEQAKQERDALKQQLDEQDAKIAAAELEHKGVMDAIGLQGKHMEDYQAHRTQILETVTDMKSRVQSVLSTSLRGIPTTVDVSDDEELVDAVVQACRAEVLDEDDEDVHASGSVVGSIKTAGSAFGSVRSNATGAEPPAASGTGSVVQQDGFPAVGSVTSSVPSLMVDDDATSLSMSSVGESQPTTPPVRNATTLDSVREMEETMPSFPVPSAATSGWSVPDAVSSDDEDEDDDDTFSGMYSINRTQSSGKDDLLAPLLGKERRRFADEDEEVSDEHVTATF